MSEDTIDDFYTHGVNRIRGRSPLKKRILELLPEYLVKQLMFEAHMLGVRLRSRLAGPAVRGKTDLLVNVGAGDTGRDGWINIDGFRAKGITYLCDARKHLPFEDGSVKAIFTEHFVEHLDYTEEAPRFLQESFRVLKPGGIIRIIVPDIEKYLHAYTSGDWQKLVSVRPLEGHLKDSHFNFRYNTRIELINVVFRQFHEHKFAYDYETLRLLLERNGFSNIRKQEFGQSIDPDICIDAAVRAPESLYVEAVKQATH